MIFFKPEDISKILQINTDMVIDLLEKKELIGVKINDIWRIKKEYFEIKFPPLPPTRRDGLRSHLPAYDSQALRKELYLADIAAALLYYTRRRIHAWYQRRGGAYRFPHTRRAGIV